MEMGLLYFSITALEWIFNDIKDVIALTCCVNIMWEMEFNDSSLFILQRD